MRRRTAAASSRCTCEHDPFGEGGVPVGLIGGRPQPAERRARRRRHGVDLGVALPRRRRDRAPPTPASTPCASPSTRRPTRSASIALAVDLRRAHPDARPGHRRARGGRRGPAVRRAGRRRRGGRARPTACDRERRAARPRLPGRARRSARRTCPGPGWAAEEPHVAGAPAPWSRSTASTSAARRTTSRASSRTSPSTAPSRCRPTDGSAGVDQLRRPASPAPGPSRPRPTGPDQMSITLDLVLEKADVDDPGPGVPRGDRGADRRAAPRPNSPRAGEYSLARTANL